MAFAGKSAQFTNQSEPDAIEIGSFHLLSSYWL